MVIAPFVRIELQAEHFAFSPTLTKERQLSEYSLSVRHMSSSEPQVLGNDCRLDSVESGLKPTLQPEEASLSLQLPRLLNRFFERNLPGFHPRRVMLLGCFDARMSEEHRNAFERHARFQKIDAERIPESVRVAFHSSEREEFRQAPLPVRDRALRIPVP